MNWIFTIGGAFLGALFFGRLHGLVIGALFGWLSGMVFTLQSRIEALEQQQAKSPRLAAPTPRAEPEPTFIFLPDNACEYERPPVIPKAPPSPPLTLHPPRPAPPRQAAAPEPSLPEPLAWLLSGENLLVKAGVVILFFGVAFLVKYAAQRGLFPVQLRLSGAALGGAALLLLGWRLRQQRREYGLTLQGGGIGILYITVYAAFRLCALLDPVSAFVLLALIAIASGGLAVGQNALTLALFGVFGGFLAPLLAPSGGGPALLFGYYLLLNLGIAASAWYRAWRLLNLTGFVATFVIGLWWGGSYYRPEYFNTIEPFLLVFFILYVAIATLFAWRQPPGTRGVVDGTLVFGTPIAAFALQALLVADYRYGLAWSALTAGLFYLGCSGLTLRVLPELSVAFGVFGALFLTLAIPLACDGRWTSALWAIEGAAIVCVALRQGRTSAALCGIVLQFAAGTAFLLALDRPAADVAFLNALYFGTLLLTVAALASAWRLRSTPGELSCLRLDRLLTLWGLLWWYGGGLREIERFALTAIHPLLVILFLTITAIAGHLLGRHLEWDDLAVPGLLLLPTLALAAGSTGAPHPLAAGGWWGWPLALVSLGLILYRDAEILPAQIRTALLSGAIWLLTALATWELLWQVQERFGTAGSWRELTALAAPCLLVAIITRLSRSTLWPCGQERVTCLGVAALPLALWSWLWVIVSTFNAGDPWPFPCIPFGNPLDLGVIVSLVVLLAWWQRVTQSAELAPLAAPLLVIARYLGGATLFLWLNAVLARGVSHWRHLPYALQPLFHSAFVQTSFSLLWSLLALGAMFCACRRQLRPLWLVGAGLLVAVVTKLFLVDLAGHGSIERIVSFVAVGLLLLVIGWFAPVPPAPGKITENSGASHPDS